MKYMTTMIAGLLLAIATLPVQAAENYSFDAGHCMALSQQYNESSETMTFGQMDELRNCIVTIVDIKKMEREAEKADRAIIKLYGRNKG